MEPKYSICTALINLKYFMPQGMPIIVIQQIAPSNALIIAQGKPTKIAHATLKDGFLKFSVIFPSLFNIMAQNCATSNFSPLLYHNWYKYFNWKMNKISAFEKNLKKSKKF